MQLLHVADYELWVQAFHDQQAIIRAEMESLWLCRQFTETALGFSMTILNACKPQTIPL